MNFQTFQTSLESLLRQPKGIAMLASVGVHGICFAGLALFPATGGQPLKQLRVVSLIRPPQQEPSSNALFPGPINPPPPPLDDLSPFDLGPDFSVPQIPQTFFNNPRPPIADVPFQSFPVIPPTLSALPTPQPGTSPTVSLPPPPNIPAANEPTYNAANPDQLPILEPGSFGSQPTDPSIGAMPSPEPGVPGKITDWTASNRQRFDTPSLVPKRLSPIPVEYPQKACKERLEGEALIGAIFDADGQLISAQEAIANSNIAVSENPEFFNDTGHPILNDAALEAAKSYLPGATGRVQAYLIPVEFRYSEDVCLATSTPTDTSKPELDEPGVKPEEPQPQSSTKPKAKPEQSQPQPSALPEAEQSLPMQPKSDPKDGPTPVPPGESNSPPPLSPSQPKSETAPTPAAPTPAAPKPDTQISGQSSNSAPSPSPSAKISGEEKNPSPVESSPSSKQVPSPEEESSQPKAEKSQP